MDQERAVNIPKAIWMPSPFRGGVPDCYQGTPLEMVEQMAQQMSPNLDVPGAIDVLIEALAEDRNLQIELRAPQGTPEDVRAGMFVLALVLSGVAEEMPAA
jgi:hypothetical protein